MKIIFFIGAGVILLLIPTVWLAARNWSPEVYKPIISIAIGGIVALLITLLTILRDSEEQRQFVSSVVIDNRTRLPVIGIAGDSLQDGTTSHENRIRSRHAILGIFSELTKDAISVQSDEREDAIAAEFFEYKLLYDIATSQRPESKVYRFDTDEEGIHRMYAKIQKNILPPEAVMIERESLQKWFKNNRLFNSQVEMYRYNLQGMWMPQGARLTLSSRIVDTIPERLISIEIPNYLTALFRIRGLGSPGVGILPPAVVVDKAELKHYQTYGIDVIMNVHYKWISAASPKMPAYKQWISSLFAQFELLNSDDLHSQSLRRDADSRN